MERRLIDYDTLSHMLGMKKATLYSMVSKGTLPHIRFSTRLVRFDLHQIELWVDERRHAGFGNDGD